VPQRIAHRCCCLPLALGLVAGHIRATLGWMLTDYADRLDERHADRRLDGDVELALDLSCQPANVGCCGSRQCIPAGSRGASGCGHRRPRRFRPRVPRCRARRRGRRDRWVCNEGKSVPSAVSDHQDDRRQRREGRPDDRGASGGDQFTAVRADSGSGDGTP
jgi:hypothetical protein